ncbi:MIP/aquaporin family protein [Georgenia sp. SUBG003]|uniref:MIP/aquaporin family protein n=1 Tax=Georgenia sp. SUBG003 TaxID=1497974 RepID=UPI003AB79800
MLTLLGCGVVANVILPKTKGFNSGWVVITFGWGLAVFAGVYVAYKSGAHLNPAVTLGLAASGSDLFGGNPDLDIAAVPSTFGNIITYLAGEFVGAFIGAVLAFLAFKTHFDQEAPGATKLAVFSTGPEIRSYGWNFVTEVIGTFVLVFVIILFGPSPSGLGPLAVALLVVSIGMSLGGPTGYAINPARDLGPPCRPRRPADPRQGAQRLGLLLGPGGRPDRRWCDRRSPRRRRHVTVPVGRHLRGVSSGVVRPALRRPPAPWRPTARNPLDRTTRSITLHHATTRSTLPGTRPRCPTMM